MKIIYNKYLPIKGYAAFNLFGLFLARREYKPLSAILINHESIHTAQMKELLYIGFYLWYGVEWLVRLIQYRNTKQAYYNISFEREAYTNDQDATYLKGRKPYAFIWYLMKV